MKDQKKPATVIGLGDLVLSLAPTGFTRFLQAEEFGAFYTGAEANVCAALSCFDIPTRYLTRVPKNEIGQAAINNLRRYGIDTSFVARGGDRIGVLYLEKGASQRPSKVIYDRFHSGFCEATVEDFDLNAALEGAGWLHFSGITPALSDGTEELTRQILKLAKQKGITVSCDLNYRKNLWTSEKANKVMSELLPYVDVLIANEEDAAKVLGIHARDTDVDAGKINAIGYIDVAKQIHDRFGIQTVATTLRESISASRNIWSAMMWRNGEAYFSEKYDIQIVNRVGGGDSFSAGLIYALVSELEPQKAVEFAAAASCLKHTVENDFNLVTVDEVTALANGDKSGRVKR
ncbi:MAG: sugar kinase [Clostridia bacterium]|nr:sugar kinase [Clostridia bacterium]